MVRHGDSNAFHVAPDAPRRSIVRVGEPMRQNLAGNE
jgi:hypothetical protein